MMSRLLLLFAAIFSPAAAGCATGQGDNRETSGSSPHSSHTPQEHYDRAGDIPADYGRQN